MSLLKNAKKDYLEKLKKQIENFEFDFYQKTKWHSKGFVNLKLKTSLGDIPITRRRYLHPEGYTCYAPNPFLDKPTARGRRFSAELYAEIFQKIQQKIPYSQIAEEYKTTRATVCFIAKKQEGSSVSPLIKKIHAQDLFVSGDDAFVLLQEKKQKIYYRVSTLSIDSPNNKSTLLVAIRPKTAPYPILEIKNQISQISLVKNPKICFTSDGAKWLQSLGNSLKAKMYLDKFHLFAKINTAFSGQFSWVKNYNLANKIDIKKTLKNNIYEKNFSLIEKNFELIINFINQQNTPLNQRLNVLKVFKYIRTYWELIKNSCSRSAPRSKTESNIANYIKYPLFKRAVFSLKIYKTLLKCRAEKQNINLVFV